MSSKKNIKEFPDLSSKLAAPAKKSLFERQRAEAEAKRIREEAETAAVYNDFVRSFDDDEKTTSEVGGFDERPRAGKGFEVPGPRAPAGPPRRHFAPGGRGSGPGSLGPSPSLSRKREFDGSRANGRGQDKGLFAFEDSGPPDAAAAFRALDEEDKGEEGREAERAAPKPTVQLSSLPPGTSPSVIRSLMPDTLKIEGIRIVPPSGPGQVGSTERKSMSAIVTLAPETPATDIDTAVSSLQNKYVGWGFTLSISRHLSSAALGSMNTAMTGLSSGSSSLPFNAQPVPMGPSGLMNRAPPPDLHRGGIAPPSSYTSQSQFGRPPPLHVKVRPPTNIRQLKLIHKTLEALLTHGPEFEALLMSRPEVQKEEKWAWIWDSRSIGGIWYRWRLWQILTGAGAEKGRPSRVGGIPHRLFDGSAAPWAEPEETLPFEFTTKFEEIVSDSDYNSSDEDDSGDDDGPRKRRRQMHAGGGPPPEGLLNASSEEQTYLNPLQKAKLTHLLARLPTSTGKLRKGDVARVTAFAIAHAGRGAEEVVEMLVANVLHPFSCSRHANPERKLEDVAIGADSDGIGLDGKDDMTKKDGSTTKEDVSPSITIALHCISDILSASSTAGVRHSWRYRALFETALMSCKIFAYLGRLEKTFGWGRLRAEKWRRSVNGLLGLWEGWCVFPADTQEAFVKEFEGAARKEEEREEDDRAKKDGERNPTKDATRSKWKTVDVNEVVAADQNIEAMGDVDGAPMEDIDGAPMEEDLDGEPMDDVDGEPMQDDELNDAPMPEVSAEPVTDLDREERMLDAFGNPMEGEEHRGASGSQREAPPAMEDGNITKARRTRPKAEDMFADSDDDE